MITFYDHQQKIVDDDPKKVGLFLGTGSGKTRTALALSRGKVLIVAPKTQVEDANWQREAYDFIGWQRKFDEIRVVSKETFRRDVASLVHYQAETLIVDEAHTCLGVTPNVRWRNKVKIPKTSQLFEALEFYVKQVDPARIYLATATIIKSPMTVWGAAKILGKTKGGINSFLDFRDKFYTQLPMPGREVYAPRGDSKTKDRLAKMVRELGYTGRLEDFFDVPEQTFRTFHVELTPAQQARIGALKLEFPDPLVLIGKRHQVENGVLAGDEYTDGETYPNAKIDRLLELAEEFPRMVVFAKYRAQIGAIAASLEAAGHKTFILTGDTKDRGALLLEANRAKSGVFIAQAQISAGWELPEYPCMVFASRTYSFVDYSQALGRIQRANNIKKNLYINLVVKGGIDEAVDKSLANKADFDARIYLNL